MSSTELPTKNFHVFKSHIGPVHVVRYDSSGEYVLTGGQDRTLKLWNPETGLVIKTYEGHGKEVLGASITRDHSKFVSCGGDRQVFLFDVTTARTIRRFEGHQHRINAVDFNRDGTVVVSGSYDSTVRIWDCRGNSRYPIQILEEAKDSVASLQVSDYEIITGSVDGNIRRYDLRAGALLTDLISQPITSVCFSGDGNCVLASSLDDTIRLMDKDNGGLLNSFKGHKNTQYKIQSCLSNYDMHVISGSEDGNIYIWDLLEGKLLSTINQAHGSVVTCVAYNPKQPVMISTSVDGTAKVWKTQSLV
ncbi:7287_t:CDS:2 [Ambispora gerdemannii]|uniref:7287_t:CDS:1 n=1 Tax=Ambispora gerdemannii TaxID=144530 RepID=A0A9N8ZH81_9GLOM|nr:7287_t:CDS:2 [Ambispora gerdemannii]